MPHAYLILHTLWLVFIQVLDNVLGIHHRQNGI